MSVMMLNTDEKILNIPVNSLENVTLIIHNNFSETNLSPAPKPRIEYGKGRSTVKKINDQEMNVNQTISYQYVSVFMARSMRHLRPKWPAVAYQKTKQNLSKKKWRPSEVIS